MSVQIPSFAHVVAEVATIRSGLTELIARLDQLETWLSTAGNISADRRFVIECQSDLESEPEIQDALPLDPATPTELNFVVSADTTNQALGYDAMCQRNASATIALDCPSAIEAVLTDSMEPAAEIAPDADSAETHSLLVAAQIDPAPAVDTVDEAEIPAADATDLSGCASTEPHCQVASVGDSDSNGQRGSAGMGSQPNTTFQQANSDPVSVTPITRMSDALATLPAVVAAQLADKAACGDAVSPVDAEAGVLDCEAQAKPLVAVSPALAMASPSTSLVVLPCPGAGDTLCVSLGWPAGRGRHCCQSDHLRCSWCGISTGRRSLGRHDAPRRRRDDAISARIMAAGCRVRGRRHAGDSEGLAGLDPMFAAECR